MATTEITTHTFGEITLRGFVDDKGNPFFVAADLANALEYHDTFNMTRMLDEDEFGYPHIVRVSSSNQHGEFDRDVEMTMVTLSGVFHAIFNSRKDEAVAFRRWVTDTVLPSIMKHGYYIVESRLEEVKAQLANSHREIARLMDDNAAERTRVSRPVRVAEAKAVASANRVRARELEAEVAESMVHAAALRVDDAVAENEDLRKMKRFLQAELRQANETIVFLQRKLHAAYVAEEL